MQYGYQFTCPHCQTTSVLIIDKQLYTPKLGEHVCITCGRIAVPNARFCQCGASLVRRCNHPDCLKEFPVDHNICDFCGWPQDISPTSDKGLDFIVQKAINSLYDLNISVRKTALSEISRIGPKASVAIPVIANLYRKSNDFEEKYLFIMTLDDLGGLAEIIEILSSESDEDLLELVRNSL